MPQQCPLSWQGLAAFASKTVVAAWLVSLSVATVADASTVRDHGNEHPVESGSQPTDNAWPGRGTGSDTNCSFSGWQTVSPINVARSRAAQVYSEHNQRFYLVGGEAAGGTRDLFVEEYDPASDTWTEMPGLATGVSNISAASVGQYIYVPGGWTGTDRQELMQRYNTTTGNTALMAPLPVALYGSAVVALGDQIHVFGGDEADIGTTHHFVYDIDLNAWDTAAPLPVATRYASAVTDGIYIYVMGGEIPDIDTVQRFNPNTGSWATLPNMETPRSGLAGFFDGKNIWSVGGGWSTYESSTEFFNGMKWQSGPAFNTGVRTVGASFGGGMALKAGGWNGDFSDVAESMDISCPKVEPICTIGEWEATTAVNTPRSRSQLVHSEHNGNFYLVGGESTDGAYNLQIEEYEPGSATWTMMAELSTGVSNTGAVAVDNYIYIAGGYTGVDVLADLQRYDILSDSVSSLEPMPAEVQAHSAVLHGGRIHVLGGSSTGNAGTTHYIYDIGNDSWSLGPAMETPVNYAVAVSDGSSIFVIGGTPDDLDLVQRYQTGSGNWTAAPILGAGRGGAGAFFDGFHVWAVGGGWGSYLATTEYFDGYRWRPGPAMAEGGRTVGVAFGDGMAMRATGWAGSFLESAETLEVACSIEPLIFTDRFED